MKEKRILDALGQVNEEYIAEAAPTKKRESGRSGSSGGLRSRVCAWSWLGFFSSINPPLLVL